MKKKFFFSLTSIFSIVSILLLNSNVFSSSILFPCYSKHGDMTINFDKKLKIVRLNEVPVSNLKISNNKIKFDQNGKDYSLHRNTGILIVADLEDLGYWRKYQCSNTKGKF